jgi:hypothetical protein
MLSVLPLVELEVTAALVEYLQSDALQLPWNDNVSELSHQFVFQPADSSLGTPSLIDEWDPTVLYATGMANLQVSVARIVDTLLGLNGDGHSLNQHPWLGTVSRRFYDN